MSNSAARSALEQRLDDASPAHNRCCCWHMVRPLLATPALPKNALAFRSDFSSRRTSVLRSSCVVKVRFYAGCLAIQRNRGLTRSGHARTSGLDAVAASLQDSFCPILYERLVAYNSENLSNPNCSQASVLSRG
ncbi:unnamed protein product [Schistocephalus solidus]|uniref:Uncharacterized protein n=1 Tax=Schistocephalus solidus TaxID=70667 RepID=A0A183SJE3_SCHSO|nr:unnamed protein product [Schistocephalus solidus]